MTDSPLFTAALGLSGSKEHHWIPRKQPNPTIGAVSLTTFKSRTPSSACWSRRTNFMVRTPKLFSCRLGAARRVTGVPKSIFYLFIPPGGLCLTTNKHFFYTFFITRRLLQPVRGCDYGSYFKEFVESTLRLVKLPRQPLSGSCPPR